MSDVAGDTSLSGALTRSIHHASGWFLGEGIVLTVLGLIAIIVPLVAGIVATVFLGWLFLIAGVIGLVSTLRSRHAPGFGWALLSAIVALLAGFALLWHPLQGLITLTFVLTAFFLADGVFMIFYAISHRREMSRKWEWMLVSGIADLVLAAIVITGFPGTLAWALGLLVGVDMIFGGLSLIAMGMAARRVTQG